MSLFQRRALRFWGWLNFVVCAAFPILLTVMELHIAGLGRAGGDFVAFTYFFIALTAGYSLLGFLVLLGFAIYWLWKKTAHDRDYWLLAASFIAVEIPNLYVMGEWIRAEITREALTSGMAILVTWVIPFKFVPVTLPVGLLLGWAAFQLACRSPR